MCLVFTTGNLYILSKGTELITCLIITFTVLFYTFKFCTHFSLKTSLLMVRDFPSSLKRWHILKKIVFYHQIRLWICIIFFCINYSDSFPCDMIRDHDSSLWRPGRTTRGGGTKRDPQLMSLDVCHAAPLPQLHLSHLCSSESYLSFQPWVRCCLFHQVWRISGWGRLMLLSS